MRGNFGPSLSYVLHHEGGFVQDKFDPGGATNKGVTQTVYDDWRRRNGLDPRSVRSLEQPELEAIYRRQYWDAVRGDELPSGVDYATFDFAVNSGPARAARFLQSAAGVAQDGKIGPVTLAAVSAQPASSIIAEMCCARQDFLRQLPTFPRFGKGWLTRCADVQAKAQAMAA